MHTEFFLQANSLAHLSGFRHAEKQCFLVFKTQLPNFIQGLIAHLKHSTFQEWVKLDK